MYDTRSLAGSRCGRRYEQEYRYKNNRDCMLFYFDGKIRFERYCYGEAASLTFGVWASGMDEDGTLHWILPEKGYYEEDALPKKLDLDRMEGDTLYFDGQRWKWELARELDSAPKNGYKPLSVRLRRLFR